MDDEEWGWKDLNFLFIGMTGHEEKGVGCDNLMKTRSQGLCFIKWSKRRLHWHGKHEGLRIWMLEGWTSC